MDYEMNDNTPTMAAEAAVAAVAYSVPTRRVTQAELNTHCLTLEESKRRLLEKVRHHYHPEA